MTVVAGTFGNTRFVHADTVSEKDEPVSAWASKVSLAAKDLLIQSVAINSTAFEGQEDGKPVFVGSKTETALLQFAKDPESDNYSTDWLGPPPPSGSTVDVANQTVALNVLVPALLLSATEATVSSTSTVGQPSSSVGDSEAKRTNLGLILGPLLGGIVLVIAVLGTLLLRRR